ncbi:unnamed protein product [Linum trigynum]|uniref:Uncharacterized protein n=1 Tax=Linum trigynum TaxID=586398 RepID=A0AAV2E5K1_9ROSI
MRQKLKITVWTRTITIKIGAHKERAKITASNPKIATEIFGALGVNLEGQPMREKQKVSVIDSQPLSSEPARYIEVVTSRIVAEMSGRDPPSLQRVKVLA